MKGCLFSRVGRKGLIVAIFNGVTAPSGQRPPFFLEASRSHSETPDSVRLLRTSDHNTQHLEQTSMPPGRFEPAIPASKRPQTHALDHAATAISKLWNYPSEIKTKLKVNIKLQIHVHGVKNNMKETGNEQNGMEQENEINIFLLYIYFVDLLSIGFYQH